MLSPFLADLLAAITLLTGPIVAGIVARRYVRRRMTREDWAAARSFDGGLRARFMRTHGLRLLGLLVGLFVYFAAVGTVILPIIEGATAGRGQAADAAQSQ